MYQVLYEEPEPLVLPEGSGDEAASHALEEVVRRCLAKEPSQRYGDLAEVVAILNGVREALRSGEGGARRAAGPSAKDGALPARPASSPAAADLGDRPPTGRAAPGREPSREAAPSPSPRPRLRTLRTAGAAALLLGSIGALSPLVVRQARPEGPDRPAVSVPAPGTGDADLARGDLPDDSLAPSASAMDPAEPDAEASPPLPGVLSVQSEPAGARVFVDGVLRGVTPLRLPLEPGRYQVRLEKDGYAPSRRSAEVAPRQTAAVVAALQAAAPPAPAGEAVTGAAVPSGEGTLQVSVRPWGHVFVDGERWLSQVSHTRRLTLPAGEHVVVAEHPGLGRREQRVTVSPGQTARFDADLRPTDVTVTAVDSTGAPFTGEIYLDGTASGTWAPGVVRDVRQGSHWFEVRSGSRHAGPTTVNLTSGEPVQVRLREGGR
jgi:hypothetical protein